MPQMLLNAQGCRHLNEHAAAEPDADEDVGAAGEAFAAGKGNMGATECALDDSGGADRVLVGGGGDGDNGGGGGDLGEETAGSDDGQGSSASPTADDGEQQVHVGEVLRLSHSSFGCFFPLL